MKICARIVWIHKQLPVKFKGTFILFYLQDFITNEEEIDNPELAMCSLMKPSALTPVGKVKPNFPLKEYLLD